MSRVLQPPSAAPARLGERLMMHMFARRRAFGRVVVQALDAPLADGEAVLLRVGVDKLPYGALAGIDFFRALGGDREHRETRRTRDGEDPSDGAAQLGRGGHVVLFTVRDRVLETSL